jgi:hypothetical protein
MFLLLSSLFSKNSNDFLKALLILSEKREKSNSEIKESILLLLIFNLEVSISKSHKAIESLIFDNKSSSKSSFSFKFVNKLVFINSISESLINHNFFAFSKLIKGKNSLIKFIFSSLEKKSHCKIYLKSVSFDLPSTIFNNAIFIFFSKSFDLTHILFNFSLIFSESNHKSDKSKVFLYSTFFLNIDSKKSLFLNSSFIKVSN